MLELTRYYKNVRAIGIILIPVALYLVPLSWLQGLHTICIYTLITGHHCYGCGITRAIISAMHFHFKDAFHYNKLVVVVFPLLVYLWLKEIAKQFNLSRIPN